ncbi:phospholipase D family protein [Thalassococcus lentus]|uniref:Phospholipase D-like domain-containing protein n=1 Tax=Thalassococcus lentus TaxID=1210524 RepID=A0ABT4XWE3_9RHOB|nr:phospholipase D-like domain-containing protein [Thalassococcus lentus]MDA7426279.1 phospholipase D-like domain-containing protein [Thalassococcus lentus]
MTPKSLITADESLPALERLIASAQTELLMSFPALDPNAPLCEQALRERGLETWADLIALVARRGVRIQMLIADFDPQFASASHRKAWAAASGFADVAQGDTQILCAPHTHRAGAFWNLFMGRSLRRAIRAIKADDSTALTPVQRRVLSTGPELRPALVRQKFAIADGHSSVVGGVDIEHHQTMPDDDVSAPTELRHDLSVLIEDADYCGALRSHFAECWNAAIDAGLKSLAAHPTRFDTAKKPQSRADLRLVRTMSQPAKGFAQLGPKPVVRDHETNVLRIVEQARRYLYIETQFLRHGPVIDALCAAAAAVPELQVVIVLPAASAQIHPASEAGWNTRHGHALQVKAVDKLRASFGKRIAFVSPKHTATHQESKPSIGSGVLICDDRLAMVGSFNLNGRSMLWDSEVSVLVKDPGFAADLLSRLAAKWIGDTAYDPRLAVTWDTAAGLNDPGATIAPYAHKDAKQLARKARLLPDALF